MGEACVQTAAYGAAAHHGAAPAAAADGAATDSPDGPSTNPSLPPSHRIQHSRSDRQLAAARGLAGGLG